ncbi:hypothetical protein AHAS_Ahas01G0081700 [Arachis hypogaea]
MEKKGGALRKEDSIIPTEELLEGLDLLAHHAAQESLFIINEEIDDLMESLPEKKQKLKTNKLDSIVIKEDLKDHGAKININFDLNSLPTEVDEKWWV